METLRENIKYLKLCKEEQGCVGYHISVLQNGPGRVTTAMDSTVEDQNAHCHWGWVGAGSGL